MPVAAPPCPPPAPLPTMAVQALGPMDTAPLRISANGEPAAQPSGGSGSSGSGASDRSKAPVGPDARMNERGRLEDPSVSSGQRTLSVFIHIGWLLGFAALGPIACLTPVVLWLIGRDRAAFVDDHGRAALDAWISHALWVTVLTLSVVGLVLVPVVIVMGVVNAIRAAIAAGRNEYFRYPLSLSILS